MKKRLLSIAVGTLLCACSVFTGCSSDNEPAEETATKAKEEGVTGYWSADIDGYTACYHIMDDSIEMLAMGQTITVDTNMTGSTIISTTEGMEFQWTYKVDGDKLTLTEDDETIELSRISKEEYKSLTGDTTADDDDDDDSINGYSVEPGVEMTVVEDDGTVVVYANDGDGTYIKSKTAPEDVTEEEDETEEETTKDRDYVTENGKIEDRVKAIQRNPYLAEASLPMPLSDLVAKYGEAHKTYDTTRCWYFDDGYTLEARCVDDDIVYALTAYPTDYSIWYDLNTDFSTIDVEKTYTYDEMTKVVGSAGIAREMSNINGTYKYTVTWYDVEGNYFAVNFDLNTNESYHITR